MGMANAIEQLEYAILLIKQNGKDYLDERDIPVLNLAIHTMKRFNGEYPGIDVDNLETQIVCFLRNHSIEELQKIVDSYRERRYDASYEARLKADMVAMLEDILKDFEKAEPWDSAITMIQDRINALKGDSDGA